MAEGMVVAEGGKTGAGTVAATTEEEEEEAMVTGRQRPRCLRLWG